MSDRDQSKVKAWVECWQRAGPALERVRRKELRAFRYEDHLEAVDALLEIGCQLPSARRTSGLVEQQRLFAKARP